MTGYLENSGANNLPPKLTPSLLGKPSELPLYLQQERETTSNNGVLHQTISLCLDADLPAGDFAYRQPETPSGRDYYLFPALSDF